ncbi:SGNH hydrolase domain-containing protein, partial [Curtobacterium sp. MMLR14_014]
SQVDLHRPEIAEAERRAVSAVGGTAVDPFPWLCTTTCSPVVWNVLAYRDADHITDTVATVLTPRVAEAIGSAG